MFKVAFITAMQEEFTQYKDAIHSSPQPLQHPFFKILLEGKIVSIISGIGKANAAAAATFAIEEFHPDLIINVGTCGGFAPCVVGDIIIANSAGYCDVDVSAFGYQKGQIPHEPQIFTSAAYPRAQQLRYSNGVVCTGDTFIDSAEKAQSIKKIYPNALCAEMEGAAIAQICHHYQKPFILVKKVSDLADKDASAAFSESLQAESKTLRNSVSKIMQTLSQDVY